MSSGVWGETAKKEQSRTMAGRGASLPQLGITCDDDVETSGKRAVLFGEAFPGEAAHDNGMRNGRPLGSHG